MGTRLISGLHSRNGSYNGAYSPLINTENHLVPVVFPGHAEFVDSLNGKLALLFPKDLRFCCVWDFFLWIRIELRNLLGIMLKILSRLYVFVVFSRANHDLSLNCVKH